MGESKFIVLSVEELQSMASDAALKAATIVSENMERMRVDGLRKEKKKKIHNTDLLLNQYRALKVACKNAVFEKTEKIKVDDVLEEIMAADNDAVVVESIKRSAERTELMLIHIDKMIETFRIYCSKCGEKERREYKIIKALFISSQKRSIKSLAKEFKVSEVTIYADLKRAKEKLSVLFFGINGLKFYD